MSTHSYQETGSNDKEDKAVLSRSKRAKYLGGALTAICELMRSYGISKKAAEREFRTALARGYSVGAHKPSREVRPISQLADVCTRWHLDKKYVDTTGQPRALTWNGKTGTLMSLATMVVGKEGAHEVIAQLISRRLVRKTANGMWLPKAKVVAPSGFDNAQTLRTATMMERLIRTISHNSKLKYRGPVLLELMAQVSRLPSSQVPNFRKFTKAQGLVFAKSVDDWLEARNLPRSTKKRKAIREAGIVAFAFDQPSSE